MVYTRVYFLLTVSHCDVRGEDESFIRAEIFSVTAGLIFKLCIISWNNALPPLVLKNVRVLSAR